MLVGKCSDSAVGEVSRGGHSAASRVDAVDGEPQPEPLTHAARAGARSRPCAGCGKPLHRHASPQALYHAACRHQKRLTPRGRLTLMGPLTKDERQAGRFLGHPPEAVRPITRGDCLDAPRPCPWVSCKWHLYLDVTAAGTITLNFPAIEPDQMRESCALDVADRGGVVLETVGELLSVTRERIRQVEAKAMSRALPRAQKAGL